MTFETVICITDEDRKILIGRKCNNCSTILKRPQRMGLEQWINTKYCCKMCMLTHRKEVGLILENKEYKCRAFTSNNDAYGLTVPKWFVDKYDLYGCYFRFKYYNGQSIIYTYTKKTKGAMKIRTSGFKNYMQIGIPSKIVKEHNLKEKLFKFKEIGRRVLFYSEI